jgi:hypothetical protein
MGLSNVERQRRFRARQQALVKANPEVAERALLEEAEQCAQLSDAERIALADKLADMAMGLLHRAQQLAAVARKLRHRETG